jgi:hypothetical protein
VHHLADDVIIEHEVRGLELLRGRAQGRGDSATYCAPGGGHERGAG